MKLKKFIKVGMCPVAAVVMLASCSDDDNNMDKNSNADVREIPTTSEFLLTRSEEVLNENVNDFSIKLFNAMTREVHEKDNGNFTVAPFSAAYALSILANSCDEGTASQISGIIGSSNLGELNSLVRKLNTFLPDKSNGMTLSLVNSLWYNPVISPTADFKKVMDNDYFAPVIPIDFMSRNAARTINEWCSRNTYGKVDEIVSSDDFTEEQMLFIANAMYFDAEWESAFIPEQTTEDTFCNALRSKVRMMHNKSIMRYVDAGTWSATEIPYVGNYSMLAILPAGNMDVFELGMTLKYSDISKVLESAQEQVVDLKMPKVSIEGKSSINNALEKLGLNLSPGNFDGICPGIVVLRNKVDVKQFTSLTVDEYGTVGAAVTSISVEGSGDPSDLNSVSFHLNRPFIYFIVNRKSGSVIMAGIVANP